MVKPTGRSRLLTTVVVVPSSACCGVCVGVVVRAGFRAWSEGVVAKAV